jgi:hypothetical protein
MNELIFLIIDGVLLIGGILALRAGENAHWRAGLVAFDLQFPLGVKFEALTSFVVGLSGLAAPRWRRVFAARGVVLEVEATPDGLCHRLLVPRAQVPTVLASLRAHLPAVRTTEVPLPTIERPTTSVQLGLSSALRPLNTSAAAAVTAGLVSGLQPLGPGEQVIWQWIVQPCGPMRPVEAPAKPTGRAGRPWPLVLFSPPTVGSDAVKAHRAKRALPLFGATARIGVSAPSPLAARGLLARVTSSLHAANAPGAHLFRRGLPGRVTTRNLTGRFLPLLVPPCELNAAELGMLLGWPHGEAGLPGLRYSALRLLAPSSDIPARGRVVATATFPGAERPLALSVIDSLRHLHVIGPTGTGKSTLLLGLITQDMAAGRGVVVIDPKGDLAADVLDCVPPGRVGDVVVLDPADEDYPVGLNLLAGKPETAELLVDQVVGTIHNLFAASWGPRTDDILRATLLTLVAAPGMTLCEVPLLLTDPALRRRLVGRIDDPVALGPFWAWYESVSAGERTQAIGPVLNKLRAFLLRRKLRNVLGQASPRLDLAEVLREGRILVVPLAKGLLGEEAAALLGSLVIARLWQTVQARAAQPVSERRPVFVYIDEFQDYLHLPLNVADVLAQARGLGLGLTLAHQHLGQLPASLREAVLANARSRVIFQTAAADAQALARELAPHLGAADLRGLGSFEVALSLSVDGRVAPPTTGRTLPPPPPTGLAASVRERSRSHYGQPRADVEAAIRARHTGSRGTGPIGRREVSS